MPEEMVMLGYFRFQTVATEQTLSLMVVMSDKVSQLGIGDVTVSLQVRGGEC